MSNSKKIAELEAKIREADEAYWKNAAPIMEDAEYDSLVRELQALDPKNPLVTEVHASGNLDTTKLVKHPVPMLSLQKAYSLEEVMKWAQKYARSKNEEFIIMPKYDGISGRWENGKLTSRGNGEWGQDYTDRVPLLDELPAQSTEPVFGEILITNKQWESYDKIQTKSGKPFKNQRNAAAGIIGCDDIGFYAKQGKILTFMDYGTLEFRVKYFQLEKEWNGIVEQLVKLCGCPIDGIVVKLADRDYWKSLGHSAHHPYGSIAFKFTNKAVWTKLIGITWSMGKDQLTAVGQVEPVDISGTTVQNVKLQMTPAVGKDGVKFCLSDGSLQIGDEVEIERAGDIIPHMKDARPGKRRTPVKLDRCPFCGAPLNVMKTSVQCTNDKCSEKVIRRLLFAAQTLGFKGIAESYIRKLYEILGVDSVRKMLEVSEADLRRHFEFGSKMVDLFMREQAKALKSSKEQMLTAMDMDSIGNHVSKVLLKHFDWNSIINGMITESMLMKIPGIGEKTAEEAASELQKNADEIKALEKMFKFTEKKTDAAANASTKGFVCFTGKSEFPRKEMQKKATEMGWAVEDSITSNTTLLVCADPTSGSSKLKKAAAKGIKIMSDVDFLAGKA